MTPKLIILALAFMPIVLTFNTSPIRSHFRPLVFGSFIGQKANSAALGVLESHSHARIGGVRAPRRRSTKLHIVDPSSVSDIDPVVVSGAFWATLRSKIISSIIGNLIGGVVIAVGGGLVGSAVSEWKNKGGDSEGGIVQKVVDSAGNLKDSVTEKVKEKVDGLKENVEIPRVNFDDIPKPTMSNPGVFTVPSALALTVSVILDLLGDASYSLPFLGDASDIVFAPIAGLVLYKLYGSNIITVLGVVEELLPGADFIPTGTIAWYFKYVVGRDSKMRDFFGFSDEEEKEVIDVGEKNESGEKKDWSN